MSDSYHVTKKDLKGFSKKDIDEMVEDKDSLLHKYAEKRLTKSEVKKKRNQEKNSNNER